MYIFKRTHNMSLSVGKQLWETCLCFGGGGGVGGGGGGYLWVWDLQVSDSELLLFGLLQERDGDVSLLHHFVGLRRPVLGTHLLHTHTRGQTDKHLIGMYKHTDWSKICWCAVIHGMNNLAPTCIPQWAVISSSSFYSHPHWHADCRNLQWKNFCRKWQKQVKL